MIKIGGGRGKRGEAAGGGCIGIFVTPRLAIFTVIFCDSAVSLLSFMFPIGR